MVLYTCFTVAFSSNQLFHLLLQITHAPLSQKHLAVFSSFFPPTFKSDQQMLQRLLLLYVLSYSHGEFHIHITIILLWILFCLYVYSFVISDFLYPLCNYVLYLKFSSWPASQYHYSCQIYCLIPLYIQVLLLHLFCSFLYCIIFPRSHSYCLKALAFLLAFFPYTGHWGLFTDCTFLCEAIAYQMAVVGHTTFLCV